MLNLIQHQSIRRYCCTVEFKRKLSLACDNCINCAARRLWFVVYEARHIARALLDKYITSCQCVVSLVGSGESSQFNTLMLRAVSVSFPRLPGPPV